MPSQNRGRGCWVGRQSLSGRGQIYEKIEVFGKAQLRVKNNRIARRRSKSNAMGLEGGQKVFVVVSSIRLNLPIF